MYPSFCRYRADPAHDDPYFAAVAADFGLGSLRPGLAVAALDGRIEVLVAADGRTALLPGEQVYPGLRDDAALAMMDAMEEAIEDARASGPEQVELVGRLEATLALLERCLDGEFSGM